MLLIKRYKYNNIILQNFNYIKYIIKKNLSKKHMIVLFQENINQKQLMEGIFLN